MKPLAQDDQSAAHDGWSHSVAVRLAVKLRNPPSSCLSVGVHLFVCPSACLPEISRVTTVAEAATTSATCHSSRAIGFYRSLTGFVRDRRHQSISALIRIVIVVVFVGKMMHHARLLARLVSNPPPLHYHRRLCLSRLSPSPHTSIGGAEDSQS